MNAANAIFHAINGLDLRPRNAVAASGRPIFVDHLATPVNTWTWCAYRDGDKDDGPHGWGRTAEMAIDDLEMAEAETPAEPYDAGEDPFFERAHR